MIKSWQLALALVAAVCLIGVWIGWQLKPSRPAAPQQIPITIHAETIEPIRASAVSPTEEPRPGVPTQAHPDSTLGVGGVWDFRAENEAWGIDVRVWALQRPDSVAILKAEYRGAATLDVNPNGHAALRPLTAGLQIEPSKFTIKQPRKINLLVGVGGQWRPEIQPMVFAGVRAWKVWGGVWAGQGVGVLAGVMF